VGRGTITIINNNLHHRFIGSLESQTPSKIEFSCCSFLLAMELGFWAIGTAAAVIFLQCSSWTRGGEKRAVSE
jgi:hypothetical protein